MLERLRVLNVDFTLYKYVISNTQQHTTHNKNLNMATPLFFHTEFFFQRGKEFSQERKRTHLLFADDSLIFARASTNECNQLKALFDSYASASGQIFNYEKSSLLFGGKVNEQQAETIKNIFQLNLVLRYEKYLGLLLSVRKCIFIKEKTVILHFKSY